MTQLTDPVLLGIVGGAHGIRGECRVNSFTETPTDLGAYGPLTDASGNRFTVKTIRRQQNVVVVKFAEIADRNQAERLNGRKLFVERALLPQIEETDEFYLDDLIGLGVRTVAGEEFGSVTAVHNFGAGDVIEIAPERGSTVMIPFSQAAVPEIDLEEGFLVVEPVAAGLADAQPDGEDRGEGDGEDPDDAIGETSGKLQS